MSDFDVIENTEEARKEYGLNYGYEVLFISKDDIEALLNGKQLATTYGFDEYSIFIRLEE